MHTNSLIITCILGSCFALSSQAIAATYFVDSANGDDSSTGLSESSALQTIAAVNDLTLRPGDSVLFRRGQSFTGVLEIAASGSLGEAIAISAWGTGTLPVLFEILITGDFIIIEDVIVEHEKADSDAIRLRGGQNCVIRRVEVRNGTRDGIDADSADGLLIEDAEIHHFLGGSFGNGDDAHGVVATNTVGITLREVNIHHVSGDSFQADPNRLPGHITDDILIEDSVLWTGPLSEDFNAGWHAGDSPGENAIDTKVLENGYADEIRMDISLVNVTAYGWTPVPEISNRAAFNLKEKINAVLDRITVYNSEIAFRVRGGRGNADTTIMNAVIYDVGYAVRAEDDVRNLKVYNSTFADEISEHLHHAGGSAGTDTWDWRNNAFLNSKPAVAAHASNVIALPGDFVASELRDYRLVPESSLIGHGVTLSVVGHDRNAQPRTVPYDSGAFEYSSDDAVRRPKPPTNLAAD